MSFGIQVLVDARQVEAAKKSVTGLSSLLDDMEKRKEINMGGALGADAEALRRASAEITRLGSMARVGENKGGMLNVQQWRDVDRLTKNIGGYLKDWTNQTAKMKADLGDVNARIADMNRAMSQHMAGKIRLSDSAIRGITSDLDVLGGEKSRLEKDLAARAKYDARANNLSRIAHEHGDTISGFSHDSMNQMGKSIASKVMSAMAWTAGAVGVMTIGQALNKSLQTYKLQEVGNADLANMGISPFRSGAYGYLYNERKGFTEDLARGTGSVGGAVGLMGLARSRSIDLGTMSGFAGSLFQSTGMNGKGATDFTASIIGTSNNTKQMVTILDGVAKMLKGQEQRQGALIGGSEAKAMAGLFALNFGKSPLLQNSSLYDRVNSTFASGGQNPGEQNLMWKLAGGDNYKGGWGDLLRIQADQRKGVFSKTVRNNTKSYLASMGREQQLAVMQSVFGLNADPDDPQSEGALMLDHVFMSGIDFNDENELRKALPPGKTAEQIIGAIRQSKVLSNEQMKENLASAAGHKIGPGIINTEGALYKSVNDLLIGKKGAAKDGIKAIWDSSLAGKVIEIGAVGAAGGLGYKMYKGSKTVANGIGGRSTAIAASRRLPFFEQAAKYMKVVGRATGAGIAADILLSPKDGGGGFSGNDEANIVRSHNPRQAAAEVSRQKADNTGGIVPELQAISVTLAMILTLLSGVINIGGANAQGSEQ